MNAGKTKIPTGTKIRTTKQWDKDITVTGTITHPFGCFGGNPIAGIYIDKECQEGISDIGNLYKGDFEVINRASY
jgi:hypothetical protein